MKSARDAEKGGSTMAVRTYVAPRAGAGTVNLRSAGRVEPATLVGSINEGTRLEYVGQTGGWYVCKVYVSTLVAEAVNGFIKLKAGGITINIRSSPVVENNTDV